MSQDLIADRAASVPDGAWAVGVSGGADSVALLSLLRDGRPGLRLHVVHLDHETRGGASAIDARFVADLCAGWGLPHTIGRRGEVERLGGAAWPANRSARFRAVRFRLFARVCAAEGLSGVILAHHADDLAETFVQRLLRSSAPAGLIAMGADARVGGLRILRPLLDVRGAALRDYLRARGRAWREDASNGSAAYQRNRVRRVLAAHPGVADAARDAAHALRDLVGWARAHAPALGQAFPVRRLADAPDVLAAEAARRWLADRGAARAALSPAVLARLVEMARDAGTAARQQFPGGVTVRRRRGEMGVI